MAVAIAVLVATPGTALGADLSLTLTEEEVPGFKAAGSGAKLGLAAFGGALPTGLNGSPRGAAFRAGARRLLVGVVPTGSITPQLALRAFAITHGPPERCGSSPARARTPTRPRSPHG